MDPNANLDEQRRIINRALASEIGDAEALRLAELARALDEWISSGGFLPRDWQGVV